MKINSNFPPATNANNSNSNDNKNNVSFTGSDKSFKQIAKDEFNKLFTLKRQGTMSRGLFIANAFVFLLGTRLVTSRDKDEKREIIIRDVPSIILAVIGVPLFSKIIAKGMQKSQGFAITKLDKDPPKSELVSWIKDKLKIKSSDKVKPKLSELSFAEINSLYTYNVKCGLEGFSKRLTDLGEGVDLTRIYSKLSNEIKEGIEKLKPENNQDLLGKLKNDEKLSNSIIEALKDGKNAAVKKAGFLKSIPAMLGFGITLSLLGIIIPKTNIFVTARINKKRALKEKETQEVKKKDSPSIAYQKLSTGETKKAFEQFANK